jgi:hypothetical protein
LEDFLSAAAEIGPAICRATGNNVLHLTNAAEGMATASQPMCVYETFNALSAGRLSVNERSSNSLRIPRLQICNAGTLS